MQLIKMVEHKACTSAQVSKVCYVVHVFLLALMTHTLTYINITNKWFKHIYKTFYLYIYKFYIYIHKHLSFTGVFLLWVYHWPLIGAKVGCHDIKAYNC